ncbi:hypothetical protein GCM10010232_16120 [Streptomyces amakusaensis]|uniref:Tetratricopeptide repeat protein n=1 Tax=Streptomyces amakusaensis TaxID=67271 RepID=A0ABW0AJH9_9ACTN
MRTRVDLFEEHGEVAALWPDSPYRDRTVVCFDRHLDLKPLAPGGEEALRAAVANSASPAGLVRGLPVRGVPGAFGLDDFWSAAAVAADLKHLVWVPSWGAGEGWEARAVNGVSLIATGGEPAEPVVSDCCLTVTLCGVRLAVVPPELLSRHLARHVTGEVVTDIDLDWLVDEHGTTEHSADRLAELVTVCGGEVSAMSWSTRSGFLPAEFRSVGPDVARRLGLEARESSYLPPLPWPEDLMLRVHRGAGVGDPSGATGAPGVVLALLGLSVADGDPDGARTLFERAAALGHRSSWLAYRIGATRYARGEHRAARTALREAAAIDPRDTLGMHARVLCARATLRLDGPGPALAELRAVADELPLRSNVWRTVALLAASVDDREAGETARHRLSVVDTLTRGRSAGRP